VDSIEALHCNNGTNQSIGNNKRIAIGARGNEPGVVSAYWESASEEARGAAARVGKAATAAGSSPPPAPAPPAEWRATWTG
jgi:hypothetical protein